MEPIDNIPSLNTLFPPYILNTGITLELHVPDVEVAVEFFLKLDFTVISRAKHFSVVRFGDSIILLGYKKNNYLEKSIGELRIFVKDIDSVYHEVIEKCNLNPPPKLFNAKYGLREFVMDTPFGIQLRLCSLL